MTNLTNGQLANITISGDVKKCSDGSPFEGATVTVKQNGEEIANITTKNNGSYILTFQSFDRIFNVTASYNGHKPYTQEVAVNDNLSGNADFKLGNNDAYVFQEWESSPWIDHTFSDGTTINGNAPNAFYTISKGIKWATYSAPSQIYSVYIAPGNYSEDIDIDLPVNLYGENPVNTIIDFQLYQYAVYITINSYNMSISGLTFTNGQNYDGGAIWLSSGTLNITNCIFQNNLASNYGGAIYNNGNCTVNFSRFYNNSATIGKAIYNNGGTVNATNNWWGTNDPAIIGSFVYGSVDYSPWIVLKINDTDNLIGTNENTTVNANLRYNFNGTDYVDIWAVYGNAVPDVNVLFNATLGNLSLLNSTISNGLNATTVFTGIGSGNGTVNATVDDQTVTTTIMIMDRNHVYVAPDGNDDTGNGSPENPFQSLAKALAEVQATGTVHVANGTYSGVKNKGLNIISDITILFDTWRGSGTVIIDAEHLDRIFNIKSGVNVTLQNLTLINGNATDGGVIYNNGYLTVIYCSIINSNATGSYPQGHGGGIWNNGTIIVTNSTINNNTATEMGGGIFNDHGTCTVNNSTINNNTETIDGGGGICNHYGNLTVTNSTINNNTAMGIFGGGGIYSNGNCTVINSTVTGNIATEGGGIITSGFCTVINSTFKQNTATSTDANDYGGGGIQNLNCICTVTNSTFIQNTAVTGGGISNPGAICTLNNSTLIQNTAVTGGGIYNYFYSIFNVINSTITGNIASDGGGIVNLWYANCTITNSTINNNTAMGSFGGGGIFNADAYCTVTNSTINNNNAPNGGGILNDGAYCTVTNSTINNNTATEGGGGGIVNMGICTVTNSTINKNIATEGGGILNTFNCTVTNSTMDNNNATEGGGIYNRQGNLSLNNSTISNNNATQCGSGIYNKYGGNCELIDSTIMYNTADQQGGGIYNNGTCTVNNSSINYNNATDGGAIYNNGNITVTNSTLINNNATHGGGIFNSGVCIVINSSINHNTAAFLGGGIYNYMYGTFTVTNSDISNNIVDYYGGGIYNDYGSNCTVTNSTINNNTATKYSGGGIYNYQNSNCTVTNSTISDNTALNGGGIYNNAGICTFTNSTINNNNGGGVFNQGFCAVINSIIRNNIADNYGGGIFNAGTCEVTNSTISDNTVSSSYMITMGGGIINYQNGACTITNSTINNNSALYGGGILNTGNCTVTNSTISSNIATNGGGIYQFYGNFIVTGSTLINNQADNGGAVYTVNSNILINFNRIFNNTGSYDVFSNVTGVNATNNWWGTNFVGSNPFDAGRVNENVTADTWLILSGTASPGSIKLGGNSTVIVDLCHDQNGVYYDPASGHVPDGILVSFNVNSGVITPDTSFIVNGGAFSVFTGLALGIHTVNVAVDNQTVNIQINVNSTAILTINQMVNSPVNVGNTVTYQVSVTNNGPDTATNINIQDILPSGFTAGTPSVGFFNSSTGIWFIPSLVNLANASLNITGNATAAMAGIITNNTVTELNQTEYTPVLASNNSGFYVFAVDISITHTPWYYDTKTETYVYSYTYSNTPEYTIIVNNEGPDDATGVVIDYNIGSGLEYAGASTDGGTISYSDGKITFNIGNIPAKGRAVLKVMVRILALGNQTPELTNIAGLAHVDQFDTNSSNNNASCALIVTMSTADIGLNQTQEVYTVNGTKYIRYTITAFNNGPSNSTNVKITDVLPAQVQWVSDNSGGTYNHNKSGTGAGVWNIGNFNVTDSPKTLIITCKVVQNVTIKNTATKSSQTSGQLDWNSLNNAQTCIYVPENVTYNSTVDIQITNTPAFYDTKNGIYVYSYTYSNTPEYTVVVSNSGPDDATGVIVDYNLGSGLEYAGASSDGGTITYSNGKITFNIGTIPAKGRAVLKVMVRILALGNQTPELTNIARLSHVDQFDTNSSNNNASCALIVTLNTADIGLNQTQEVYTENGTQYIRYTITAFNNGPDNSTNVKITDILPAQVQWVSDNSSGTYNHNTTGTGAGVWNIGDLNAADTPKTLIIVCKVVETGTIRNTATKSSQTGGQFDWNLLNNAQTTIVTVLS